MMQKLTDFYPTILQRLKGAPRPIILQHLQDAYRLFCGDTEAWRPKITLSSVEDQRAYNLNAAYNAMIKRIITVWVRSEDDVDNDVEGSVQDEDYYRFYPPNELKFEYGCAPGESVTDGIIVRVVLIPELGTSDADPDFLNEWQEGILYGALRSLHEMEGKSWSSPREAQVNNQRYRAAVNRCKSDIALDHRHTDPGFYA